MDPLRSQPPRGLIVELPTLLDDQGGLDQAATTGLLQRLEDRAQGLFLFGPEVGKGPELETARRVQLLTLVRDHTSLPLMAFITHPERTASAECAEALTEIVPNLILVDAPLLARSNRDLLNWLEYLGGGFEGPVLLYNHPQLIGRSAPRNKRRNIRTAVLKRAADESFNLAGLIFRGSFKRLLNYHQAVRSKPGFLIYDAQEMRFLDRPSTSGLISQGAAAIPRIWDRVVRAALNRGPERPLAEILACGRAARALAGRLEEESPEALLKLLAGHEPPDFLEELGLERWGLMPESDNHGGEK